MNFTFFVDKLLKNDSQYEVIRNKLILKKLQTNLPFYYKCVIGLKTIGAKFAVTKKIEYRDIGKISSSPRIQGYTYSVTKKQATLTFSFYNIRINCEYCFRSYLKRTLPICAFFTE